MAQESARNRHHSGPVFTRSLGGSPGEIVLFRVGGVPVSLALSWWLGSALVVVLYAPLVGQVLSGASVLSAWVLAGAFAVLLGLSVLAHELAHCVIALRLGIPVRRVRLFLLGGITEIARNPREPRQEGVIAAAGPMVSLLLGGLCGILLFMIPAGGSWWLLVAECTVANLVVGVFNLLPGLPLDGGKMIRAAIWAATGERGKGTKSAVIAGGVIAAALVVWALWGVLSGAADRWLRLGVCLVSAWFIMAGANTELAADSRQSATKALSLTQLLRPVVQLPAEIAVSDALVAGADRAVLLVRPDGTTAGLLNLEAATRLSALSPQSAAELAVEPITAGTVVLLSDSGEDVAARVTEAASWQFLVVDDEGNPAGVLHRDDLRAVIEHGPHPG